MESMFSEDDIYLSFIILSWNSKKFLEICLDSIIKSNDFFNKTYEIFIVDNGSSDDSPCLIKKYVSLFPDVVKPIFLSVNTGTTHSRNIALRLAQGKYFCVLDSDVEVSSGTVKHLIDRLEGDSSIGLIAPRLTYGNGLLQKSTDDFPTIITKIWRFFSLKFQERAAQCGENPRESIDVDYAISAFWVFRRSLLDSVGFLDERFFYAPEDVDYCLRVWKAGFRVVYDPAVAAIHNAQEISRSFRINRAIIEHIKGLTYYFIKHEYCINKPVFQGNYFR